MIRVMAWILLLVGVTLGASGAVLHGVDHDAQRAASRHATVLERAASTLDRAEQTRTAAIGKLGAPGLSPQERATAQESVRAAEQALAQARAAVQALVDSGAVPSDAIAIHAAQARAAVPEPVSPSARLLGWLQRGGPAWGLGVVLIGVGATLARREQRRRQAGPAHGSQGSVDFPGAIRATLDEIEVLQALVRELDPGSSSVVIRSRIDALHDQVLGPVIEGRGQLVARHGLSTFATYFGALSGGERNLARAWSALTDDHLPTARQALIDSRAAFDQALEAWERAEAPRAAP